MRAIIPKKSIPGGWLASAATILPMVAGLSSGSAVTDSGRPPNIVIMLADDLGYADVGIHGSELIHTPHIDSLAKQGVRFTNAYATSPVCAPSRAGLMTGRYQHRFGVRSNRDDMPGRETTIAEILRAAGYRTGMVGKWHLGRGDLGPLNQGFEEFTGYENNASLYEREMGEYLPFRFAREAVSFIERHEDEPFFLYVAFSAPHAPVRAPDEYLSRFEQVEDPMRRAYAAMVVALDDSIGRILGELKARDLDRNTLVFFANDNGGPGISEKCAAKNASSNAPLRGFKQDVYEGGIRIPFLARWPGQLEAGGHYDRPVSLLDLLPTSVVAAGAESPREPQVDGVDLLPYVRGEKSGDPHPYLFWKHHERAAVRHGRWKLVEIGDGVSLFDLALDVAEADDLAARRSDTLHSLAEALRKWKATTSSRQ
jgi:arylsulfatase A-like enzyme